MLRVQFRPTQYTMEQVTQQIDAIEAEKIADKGM